MGDELHKYSATRLAASIRAGEVRAIDAVSACFEQIEQHDHRLKAFITLNREQAEQQAIAADEAVREGKPLGLLHGVPISIKDLTATAGIRTTCGSLLFKDNIPNEDELCVARLKAAGAIIVGKTSTPELGFGTGTRNDLIGMSRNPYDESRTCGDSSGGAAIAAATGMCYLSHGGDLGGSVRTPASFCGIVGLRPAVGRIPRVPKPLLWESLATDGVLARSVEDAALMLAAMAGWDARDPVAIDQSQWQMPSFSPNGFEDTRVGYSLDLEVAPVDHEVAAVFEQAIAAISRRCRTVQEAHPDCTGADSAFATLRAALVKHSYGSYLEQYGDRLSETVRWEIGQGNDITAAAYLKAERDRGQIYQHFLNFFDRYDVLITVSASVPPFPVTQTEVMEINGQRLNTIIDYLAITYTVSLTGLPAVSLPCGKTPSGLPVGIQLIGKPHGEAELLQFAYFLQESIDFRHQWVS